MALTEIATTHPEETRELQPLTTSDVFKPHEIVNFMGHYSQWYKANNPNVEPVYERFLDSLKQSIIINSQKSPESSTTGLGKVYLEDVLPLLTVEAQFTENRDIILARGAKILYEGIVYLQCFGSEPLKPLRYVKGSFPKLHRAEPAREIRSLKDFNEKAEAITADPAKREAIRNYCRLAGSTPHLDRNFKETQRTAEIIAGFDAVNLVSIDLRSYESRYGIVVESAPEDLSPATTDLSAHMLAKDSSGKLAYKSPLESKSIDNGRNIKFAFTISSGKLVVAPKIFVDTFGFNGYNFPDIERAKKFQAQTMLRRAYILANSEVAGDYDWYDPEGGYIKWAAPRSNIDKPDVNKDSSASIEYKTANDEQEIISQTRSIFDQLINTKHNNVIEIKGYTKSLDVNFLQEDVFITQLANSMREGTIIVHMSDPQDSTTTTAIVTVRNDTQLGKTLTTRTYEQWENNELSLGRKPDINSLILRADSPEESVREIARRISDSLLKEESAIITFGGVAAVIALGNSRLATEGLSYRKGRNINVQPISSQVDDIGPYVNAIDWARISRTKGFEGLSQETIIKKLKNLIGVAFLRLPLKPDAPEEIVPKHLRYKVNTPTDTFESFQVFAFRHQPARMLQKLILEELRKAGTENPILSISSGNLTGQQPSPRGDLLAQIKLGKRLNTGVIVQTDDQHDEKGNPIYPLNGSWPIVEFFGEHITFARPGNSVYEISASRLGLVDTDRKSYSIHMSDSPVIEPTDPAQIEFIQKLAAPVTYKGIVGERRFDPKKDRFLIETQNRAKRLMGVLKQIVEEKQNGKPATADDYMNAWQRYLIDQIRLAETTEFSTK